MNDAPSFTIGANQSVSENSGAQVLAGFVTNISAGPADENTQTLRFTVTNDNNALFTVQPSIAPNGTLTYTPADNATGSGQFRVILQDDGGTANGGLNTSASQTFTITIGAINVAPVVDLNGGAVGRDFSASFTEGGGAVSIVDSAALTVSDSDSPTLVSATITLTNPLNGALESLRATPSGQYQAPGFGLCQWHADHHWQRLARRLSNGAAFGDYITTAARTRTPHRAKSISWSMMAKTTAMSQFRRCKLLAVNNAPVAANATVQTNEDTPASFVLSASDAENDALTFAVVTPPKNGTLAGTAPNLTYTPNANFNGLDIIHFQGQRRQS